MRNQVSFMTPAALLALILSVLAVRAQQAIPVADVPALTEAMRERAMISRGDPARLCSVLDVREVERLGMRKRGRTP